MPTLRQQQTTKEWVIFATENAKRIAFARAQTGAGRKRVRQKFLLPRLMRDELKLVKEVIG